jgi:hypothetical protein
MMRAAAGPLGAGDISEPLAGLGARILSVERCPYRPCVSKEQKVRSFALLCAGALLLAAGSVDAAGGSGHLYCAGRGGGDRMSGTMRTADRSGTFVGAGR